MSTHHHDHQDLAQCREILEQLNDYADGELSATICRELEQHMAECPDCRAVYDTLNRTIKIYRSLRDMPIELPLDVEERLLQRIHAKGQ